MKISRKNLVACCAYALMFFVMFANANVKPDPCYRCYVAYVQCLQNLNNDPIYCYNEWYKCSQGLCS